MTLDFTSIQQWLQFGYLTTLGYTLVTEAVVFVMYVVIRYYMINFPTDLFLNVEFQFTYLLTETHTW